MFAHDVITSPCTLEMDFVPAYTMVKFDLIYAPKSVYLAFSPEI